ncbi:hypothetical protein K469DRAFT_56057 [Zopfia rhizophila CBS 207.26]|uniref:Mid2 domain-containing protein n=1 Tax=Zopfia rhizophila CBS 207.26 TaxID=1314779 RepID=A0A6A6D850_9PEZI|nr:hypothetical protein K469DRAFT_56057 [Zopfia rhizophila CBS 207.26]
MEKSNPSKRKRLSRIERYRHFAEEVSPKETEKEFELGLPEDEEELLFDDVNEPLLIREKKGRTVMGRGHRMFHRRQAEGPKNILTIVVDVVATVDVNGNIIGKETSTPVVQAAGVVPTVPAVPPFPSDLTVPAIPAVPTVPLPSVPAYPWPSGVPSIQGARPSSQLVISSPAQTSEASSGIKTALPTANSSISSTLLSSSTFTSINSTSTSSSFTSRSSSSSTPSSTSQTSTPVLTQASSSQFGGGGGGPTNTAPPVPTSTATSNASDSDDSPISTPKVVGGVIGGLVGAAMLLLLILFFLRRYKRKQRGAQQLPGNDGGDSQPIASSGQQMATRSSFVPAGAATFFSRFSGASRSTADTSTTGEKSFQRISGRKLPSAFSDGITSEQVARGETLSEASFYRDAHGIYGSPAAQKEFGKEIGESSRSGAMGTKERIMPSPARTPVIHHPDDAPPFGTSRDGGQSPFMSPPHSPNPEAPQRGTLGRSHPSHDGSRGSRFTEDV